MEEAMKTEEKKEEIFQFNDPKNIKEYLERSLSLEYQLKDLREDKKYLKEE